MIFFNYIGLIIFIAIMVPNIFYMFEIKKKGVTPQNNVTNKAILFFEQIGRFGSFITLIFNIPSLYYGFWFFNGLFYYILINGILVISYLGIWLLKINNLAKAILLSVIPSIIFLFSAISIASLPLFVFAIIFAPTHIYISIKNCDTMFN